MNQLYYSKNVVEVKSLFDEGYEITNISLPIKPPITITLTFSKNGEQDKNIVFEGNEANYLIIGFSKINQKLDKEVFGILFP